MILDILLAIAMVASRKGFLSSSCLSQGSPLSGRTFTWVARGSEPPKPPLDRFRASRGSARGAVGPRPPS